MARVLMAFDIFGLPVTLGAIGVLEGRHCAPGDVFGRPHHILESTAVAGSAVSWLIFSSLKDCISLQSQKTTEIARRV